MEHRKAETLFQFTHLKQECETSIVLLNQILEKNRLHLNNIDNLSPANLRKHSKYFLAVSQFQHASYQKILELNVYLEEFVVDKEQSKVEELAEGIADMLPTPESSCNISVPLLKVAVSEESIIDKSACTIEETIDKSLCTIEEAINEPSCSKEKATSNSVCTIEKTYMEDIKPLEAESLAISTSMPVLSKMPNVKRENCVTNPSKDTSPPKDSNEIKLEGSECFYSATDTRNSSSEMDFCSNASSRDFFEHVTVVNNDSKPNTSSEMEFCSNVSSHVENESLPRDDAIDSTISEKLKALPVMTLQEKCQTNNFMLDVSERLVSVNHSEASVTSFNRDDVENLKSNAKEEPIIKDVDEKIDSISEKLKALPIMTLQEKCQTNNFMLDVSEKLVSVKYSEASVTSFNRDDVENLKSYAKEEEPVIKNVDEKIGSISEKLKALSLMTLQGKCQTDNFMPDISVRSTSVKYSEGSVNSLNRRDVENHKANAIKKVPVIKDVEERIEIPIKEAIKIHDLCMISYIESPSYFYLQVADDDAALLDVIAVQLETISHPERIASTKYLTREKLGDFCATCVSDYWYRVEVIDWTMNDEKNDDVLVQFVDYGDKSTISYKKLKPILPSLCAIPKLAHPCHLAYLYPPGSTKDKKLTRWPQASVDQLLDICGNLEETFFKVDHVYYCKNRDSYEVELSISDRDDDDTIGTQLIRSEHAVEIFDDHSNVVKHSFMVNQIRKAHGIAGINSDMSQEEVLDIYFNQIPKFEANNINEAVMHYDPRDEAETCRFIRADGTCYKGRNCKLKHDRLTDGFTRDRQLVYNQPFADPYHYFIGQEIYITISHVVNVQTFYGQIRFVTAQDVIVNDWNAEHFIKMMNQPDVIKKYRKLQYPPSMNEIVIAQHWNTHWYRGQVRYIHILENQEISVEIFIVDFGDTLLVPMSNLRAIESEFMHLPYQATECRLYNVKQKSGVDPEEGKMELDKRYLGHTYKARVMANPGHLQVLLTNKQGVDIGQELIEAGIADSNTEHVFPAAKELFLVD